MGNQYNQIHIEGDLTVWTLAQAIDSEQIASSGAPLKLVVAGGRQGRAVLAAAGGFLGESGYSVYAEQGDDEVGDGGPYLWPVSYVTYRSISSACSAPVPSGAGRTRMVRVSILPRVISLVAAATGYLPSPARCHTDFDEPCSLKRAAAPLSIGVWLAELAADLRLIAV
jgi:hypothetical protein